MISLRDNKSWFTKLLENIFCLSSLGAGAMPQCLRPLAALPEDLSSVPNTHVGGSQQPIQMEYKNNTV